MRLEHYLRGLFQCPDEEVRFCLLGEEVCEHRLTAEYGIYDNFPILLNSNEDGIPLLKRIFVLKLLADMKKKGYEERIQDSKTDFRIYLINQRNTVKVRFRGSEALGEPFTTFCENDDEETLKHRDKQIRGYDTVLSLHTNTSEFPVMRDYAEVVVDICKLAKKHRIGLCLPHSRGWAHDNDLARTVYYKPRK